MGKTELTKALAEFLFDSDHMMIRIDMSEFMEKHSVARLIGAPPGYVGYEEGGYLTEAVRRKPYSVILLDEIEKAHPDVFNVLLQVLDDGRMTDGQGRTVDFKNTVIVMTSNLGSHQIQKMTDEGAEQALVKIAVMAEVKQHFRPEFVNRIDEIVVFHPLDQNAIADIARIQLQSLEARLAKMDIKLAVTDAALKVVAQAGFDPVYGARPLKRAIQQQIENPLAKEILAGNFAPGRHGPCTREERADRVREVVTSRPAILNARRCAGRAPRAVRRARSVRVPRKKGPAARPSLGTPVGGAVGETAVQQVTVRSDPRRFFSAGFLRVQQAPTAERPVLPLRLHEHDHHVLGVEARVFRQRRHDVGDELALHLHAAADRPQDFDQREVIGSRRGKIRIARVEAKVVRGQLQHPLEPVGFRHARGDQCPVHAVENGVLEGGHSRRSQRQGHERHGDWLLAAFPCAFIRQG